MAIGSLVLGIAAFICTIAAFVVWVVPVLGPIISFLAPVLAIVGIALAGVAMSRARNMAEPIGMAVTGLVVNIVVLIPALIAGISCGICSSCFTAAALSPNSNTSRSSATSSTGIDPVPQPLIPTALTTGTPIPNPTPVQLASIVGELNSMCPDTWCEGAFNFHFTSLTCQPGVCTMAFTHRHHTAQAQTPGQFQITGFTTVAQCNTMPAMGALEACTDVETTESFETAFNQAISQWETANSGTAGQQPPTSPPAGAINPATAPPVPPAATIPPTAPIAPAAPVAP